MQGYPPAFHQASPKICQDPFTLLGRERHCERKVFCPRTQLHGLVLKLDPSTQGSNAPSNTLSHFPLNDNDDNNNNDCEYMKII